MKETRNILGWLGMAEEHSIMQDALKHAEETYKTVTCFSEAVKAFINNDQDAKTAAIENVRESEKRADTLRSKMVSSLSEGMLLPPDREDLMHFAKTLDKIADWTNGAARILGFINQPIPQSALKNIATATDLIFQAVTQLKDGIQALVKNDLKKALADCEVINRIEHDADDQKKLLIESMIQAKIEPITFFLCYQLAEYLEGVTDKIQDAADMVKTIAIKSK